MNAPASFNTLHFVRRLEGAGMETRLAEALAEAMNEVVFETTATKGDLRELELKLTAEFRERTLDLESRLNTRMGVMLGASTTLTVAILGVLITLN